jgi:hypothetical protein
MAGIFPKISFGEPLNYSDPWKFGYTLGVSRRLALQAKSKSFVFAVKIS